MRVTVCYVVLYVFVSVCLSANAVPRRGGGSYSLSNHLLLQKKETKKKKIQRQRGCGCMRERVRVSVAFNLSHLQLALSWQASPPLFLLLSFLHGVWEAEGEATRAALSPAPRPSDSRCCCSGFVNRSALM